MSLTFFLRFFFFYLQVWRNKESVITFTFEMMRVSVSESKMSEVLSTWTLITLMIWTFAKDIWGNCNAAPSPSLSSSSLLVPRSLGCRCSLNSINQMDLPPPTPLHNTPTPLPLPSPLSLSSLFLWRKRTPSVFGFSTHGQLRQYLHHWKDSKKPRLRIIQPYPPRKPQKQKPTKGKPHYGDIANCGPKDFYSEGLLRTFSGAQIHKSVAS